jgi:hypothetical protein
MNIVRLIWVWIRSNWITVVSAVVLIIAVIWLGSLGTSAAAFREEVKKRDAQLTQIRTLKQQTVKVPPDKPDDPPRTIGPLVINNAAIEQLRRVYGKMNEEHANIFNLALQINQHNHLPMADGLFPDPVDNFKPYEARKRYLEAFIDMTGRYSPNALLPRLNAGMPPDAAAIKAELDRIDAQTALSVGGSPTPGVGSPAPGAPTSAADAKEAERVRLTKQAALMQVLKSRAEQLHIYGVTQMGAPGFPFELGAWAGGSKLPSALNMWEGQLGLWLQQDIVEAIARTNQVSNPQMNVIFSPIKKLESIRIAGLYVGIMAPGKLNPAAPAPTLASAGQLLPDNFAVSATGRVSNAIYDVHHVSLRVIVDYQHLPDFFDNLSKVNFMTVLKMDLKSLDEYDSLKGGYVLGSNDCMIADILIETLWLRDWTSRLTPKGIRTALGIAGGDNSAGGVAEPVARPSSSDE